MGQKMKLDPYLKPLTKINLKSTKDLKLLKETIRERSLTLGLATFFGQDPKSPSNKSKNKRGHIQ